MVSPYAGGTHADSQSLLASGIGAPQSCPPGELVQTAHPCESVTCFQLGSLGTGIPSHDAAHAPLSMPSADQPP